LRSEPSRITACFAVSGIIGGKLRAIRELDLQKLPPVLPFLH